MAIYGIDLGTTNSLLGVGDKLLTGLVPSVADIDAKTAGAVNLSNPNAVRSFKVDISMGLEGLQSIVASTEVLKQLKREAGLKGTIQAVITVPADFDDSQRRATVEAAKHADIEVVSLVNEPTAAAMYITQGKKEVAVVFDLGGGTFDVSVIDSRFGNFDVQYSAGDPKCGGDNLDQLILRYFCKQGKLSLFRLDKSAKMELQNLCTETKIRMQKERKNFVVDLKAFGGIKVDFTEDVYIQLMKSAFMKCITLLHRVINSSLEVGSKYDLVLVGGSTRCPYLREWITKEVGQKPIDITYDPDKAVAYGAALYARMVEDGEIDYMVSDITKALSIGLQDGTVQNIIPANSKVPIEEEIMLSNPESADCLSLALYQGDSGLIVNNSYIGKLVYDYGETKAPYAGNVFVTVSVEASGIVKLSCKELGKKAVTKELVIS